MQLVDKIGDESTTITVAPFGSDQRRDVKLDLRHWAFEPDKEDPVSSLGIRPRGPQIEPVLENVQPNSAASKAGLQAGDLTESMFKREAGIKQRSFNSGWWYLDRIDSLTGCGTVFVVVTEDALTEGDMLSFLGFGIVALGCTYHRVNLVIPVVFGR